MAVLTGPLSLAPARCYVPSVREALDDAKAVFVGKVISVADPTFPDDRLSTRVFNLERPLTVRFAVERVYLGAKTREIEVETKTGGLEWGYDFQVGEKYVVYAQDGGARVPGLIVKGCSRTRLVTEAMEDLRTLKDLLKAKRRWKRA
jgi:hypothetical protein